MVIDRLTLKNWRNFRDADLPLRARTYVIGANATGKSNLLDVFRFLRTLAQTDGGGLQKALKERGGPSKLRCLHARRDSEILRIEVALSTSPQEDATRWRYTLAFKSELLKTNGKEQQRVSITEESVTRNDEALLRRPNDEDRKDPERLTQPHLEQINDNSKFRALVEHFSATIYLHLVPQLLKHAGEIGARVLENDPFGQGLTQRIANTPKNTRDARLRRITKALSQVVPLFSDLKFEQDSVTGLWHLAANFTHWRKHGMWQREDQFSDGTLRLIGLLWALQEDDGLLLLEEPELSLNDSIIERIPLMIDRVLRERKESKSSRQVLISTHSRTLLSQVMDPQAVLVIQSSENGSIISSSADEDELHAMEHGLNPAEVLLLKTVGKPLDHIGPFR